MENKRFGQVFEQYTPEEQARIALSPEEHALMAGVKKHFEKVIVLLNVCGHMDMEWVDTYQPSAVLMVWIPGQEGASAAADILMGHVNPSGSCPSVTRRAPNPLRPLFPQTPGRSTAP